MSRTISPRARQSNSTPGNQADAATWKTVSQAIVTAIRNNGDNTRIHVEGVDYSNPENWALYQGFDGVDHRPGK